MKTILVVDDSRSMRRMVTFALEACGFRVLEGANGIEGLQVLETENVDLIVADVSMPEMDGITFVRHARARAATKFVPILMLTAENASMKVVEGREAGATGWIVKPFKPDKLIETVKKVLA